MSKFYVFLALLFSISLNANGEMSSLFQELRDKGGEHIHRETHSHQHFNEKFSYATKSHHVKSGVNVRVNPEVFFQIGDVIFDPDPMPEDHKNFYDNMETLFFGD